MFAHIKSIVLFVMFAVLASMSVYAQGDSDSGSDKGGKKDGRGKVMKEMREIREQLREEVQAYHKTVKESIKTFMESIKDKTGSEFTSSVESFYAKRLTDDKAFLEKINTMTIEKINALDIDSEKKTKMIEHTNKRKEEMRKKIEERIAKNKAFMLSLSDLSGKERAEAIKKHREEMKKERENMNKERKEKRDEMRAKMKEKRGKSGDDSSSEGGVDDDLTDLF